MFLHQLNPFVHYFSYYHFFNGHFSSYTLVFASSKHPHTSQNISSLWSHSLHISILLFFIDTCLFINLYQNPSTICFTISHKDNAHLVRALLFLLCIRILL